MDTLKLDPPEKGNNNNKTAAGIAIALVGLAILAIVVVATRRDDKGAPYQPASKVVDDTTLPAPMILPLGEPGATPAPVTPSEPSPSPAAARVEGTATPATRRQTGDEATKVTGEMKNSTGAAVTSPGTGEAEVTESFPPRRVTDPALIRLSREQMQLMRHYELGKTNVAVKVCLDTNGVPNDVSVVRSSGIEEVDQQTVDTIKTWTYLPQITDGRLVAACTNVQVNYQLRE